MSYVMLWYRNGPASYVGSLMDYNARFFSPALGRFVSADTIVPGAGNSQAFNRYMYVRGNPLGRIDPGGHEDCDAGPQTAAACAAAKTKEAILQRIQARYAIELIGFSEFNDIDLLEQVIAGFVTSMGGASKLNGAIRAALDYHSQKAARLRIERVTGSSWGWIPSSGKITLSEEALVPATVILKRDYFNLGATDNVASKIVTGHEIGHVVLDALHNADGRFGDVENAAEVTLGLAKATGIHGTVYKNNPKGDINENLATGLAVAAANAEARVGAQGDQVIQYSRTRLFGSFHSRIDPRPLTVQPQ